MIDLITIVFRDEVSALQTQARSIDEYISPADINSITVIVNDDADVIELIDSSWWGLHKDKVTVSQRTFNSAVLGWESQQLCKLLGAADAKSDWSMVLDAKTWFIRPMELSKLFDTEGRVRLGILKVSPHFIPSQQFVEKFYNVELNEIIGPAGVPFMFHTETVKEMIAGIDNFVDFFQTNVKYPNLITEFYLYSGYVLSKYGTYNKLYVKPQYYIPFNIANWEPNKISSLITVTNSSQTLTASVHRNAKLTEEQQKIWHDFLIERKLLNT
jgi:hypothetical protein